MLLNGLVCALAILGADAAVPSSTLVPGFLTARRAVNDATHPPDHWSATENVLWKKDLQGLAWSSPIVVGDKIFVTTCVDTGTTADPRKGLYLEDLNANLYPAETDKHLWKVIALSLTDGNILWEKTAKEGIPAKPHHIKNTLASETPFTDGKRVYALFGNVGLYCYDLEGELLWSLDLPARETRYAWGTSISPIVHDGRLFLVNDNEEESYLSCLDAESSKEIWRVARDEKTNFGTPFIWKNEKRTELVTSGINWARSYDLEGNVLWQLKGRSILAIPTPFQAHGLLYVTSGHVAWGENPFYAIKPGAAGDISPDPEGKSPISEHLAWYIPKAGPYHPTPLVVGDLLYVLHDRGLMACYEAKTGKEVYPRKRLPQAGFTTSPWAYGDKIFCLSEDGITYAVQLGPAYKVLHANHLAEDDMCMATPVIVGDRLLIRTSKRLYCIGNQK